VTSPGGIDGGRMPPGDVTDERTPGLVERWIEAGAASP
jgi:hypothetical protein